MNPQLQAVLKAYRKRDRDLAELKALRKRLEQLKNPDAKVLKMVDDAIANAEKEPIV